MIGLPTTTWELMKFVVSTYLNNKAQEPEGDCCAYDTSPEECGCADCVDALVGKAEDAAEGER